jgi:hypothetical protein
MRSFLTREGERGKLTKILLKMYNFLKDWIESTGRGIGYTPKLMTPITAILLFFKFGNFFLQKSHLKKWLFYFVVGFPQTDLRIFIYNKFN